MKTKNLDVVIPVRTGENEELRYALRSLKNLDFSGKVYIYGHKPDFVTNVEYHETDQRRGSMFNSLNNILEACKNPDISDPFILSNDDYYIKEKVDELPPKHRGDYSEQKQYSSWHYRRMMRTWDWLRSQNLPTLCYELHIPVIIHKKKFLELEKIERLHAYNKLSLYGNLSNLGGEKIEDVKDPEGIKIAEGPFLSTSETTFKNAPVGEFVRNLFIERSPYEK